MMKIDYLGNFPDLH